LVPQGGNKSWQVKDTSRNHIKAIFINKAYAPEIYLSLRNVW